MLGIVSTQLVLVVFCFFGFFCFVLNALLKKRMYVDMISVNVGVYMEVK